MILKGNEDLRVVKTITAVKSAFEGLICEKDYEKITVKELCDRAMINKKTFYHYYETLDALLAEMQAELSNGYAERIRGFALPDDLDKVNREFFLFSATQGPAYEKITCCASYRAIRSEMVDGITGTFWSGSPEFQKLTDFEKTLLLSFISEVVLTAYRQWIDGGKAQPLAEVIALTNRILLHGVNGFFEKSKR